MGSSGINAQYMEDASTPTGCCACLILDKERSLCTSLAAANNYKVDHVKKPENWKIVESAKIVYSAGFFITVSPALRRRFPTATSCSATRQRHAPMLRHAAGTRTVLRSLQPGFHWPP